MDTVKVLVSAGANVNGQTSKDGSVPLLVAAVKGRQDVVHVLLESGADTNARNHLGYTPLIGAAFNGHDAIVRDLLRHGADINAQSNVDDVNVTALMGASEFGNVTTVKVLLDAGADPNIRTHREGLTAMMFAATFGYHNIVSLLLDHGADLEARTTSNETVCEIAAESGQEDIVELLKWRSRELGLKISCPQAATAAS